MMMMLDMAMKKAFVFFPFHTPPMMIYYGHSLGLLMCSI